MMSFVLYAIALFGFSYAIGLSRISEPVRDWMNRYRMFHKPLELLECPACLSTWIGLAVAVFMPRMAHAVAGDFAAWYFLPFLSCGSSAILGLLTGVMR